ncbi:MAG TPA: glycosyl hydrolase family 8, partial [Polyangiaceae bacterium]|nr:glycosyl hydrolase family 8 [Polyangiaceae bacterium]
MLRSASFAWFSSVSSRLTRSVAACSALLTLGYFAACTPASPNSAAHPASDTQNSSASGAYKSIAYRNVFLEHGKSQAEIDAKLRLAYNTYFTPTDPNTLYFEMGPDMAYIKDILHDDIRSEGQSYGLMIAVQQNDQARFKKLWKFAFEKMRVKDPKHPSYRCFAWVVDPKGEMCDENSAPDGEEYFAMALYFAHNRWGSAAGEGYDNYKHWADDLLDAVRHRQPISGNRSRRMDQGKDDGNPCTGTSTPEPVTSVALFDEAAKMVRFNGTQGENYTDPSYHLPAFYELFAEFGPKADSAWWKEVAVTSR